MQCFHGCFFLHLSKFKRTSQAIAKYSTQQAVESYTQSVIMCGETCFMQRTQCRNRVLTSAQQHSSFSPVKTLSVRGSKDRINMTLLKLFCIHNAEKDRILCSFFSLCCFSFLPEIPSEAVFKGTSHFTKVREYCKDRNYLKASLTFPKECLLDCTTQD